MAAEPETGVGRGHHAAVVLAEDCTADMDRLERLRADAGTAFVDRLEEQREGLRHIHDGGESHESARWVHYPWRRTAVRVLGPVSFRRLRLDRNRNKITEAEQDRLNTITVGVVGLSVGHTVAHTLALEGSCGRLRLADFDVLELSNLNRLPATLLDLGVNKAVIAARRIAELDPYLPVDVWHDGVTAGTVDDFVDGLDVLVDECDSLDIKVRLRLEASRRGTPVVMETSDRGLVDVERFDLEPERPPFHGLLGDIDVDALAALSNRDKVPHVLRLLGAGQMSTRLAASLLEVDETLVTWPQLGGDVALGGAVVAGAIRRIALGAPLGSGRCRIDLEEHFERLDSPSDLGAEIPRPPVLRDKPTDPIDAVVDAAIRAPSGGNSQPWSIDVDAHRLTFALAPDPGPVLMDLHRRGSCVAIGAALHNARVAAAAHGILGPVHVPAVEGLDVHPGTPVATLEFGTRTDQALADRYEATLTRVTNRHRYDDREITSAEIATLHDAAAREDGRIRVVTDSAALVEIAAVLADSDRIRYLTRALRLDMVDELRWPNGERADHGIEVTTLGLDASEAAMLGVVLRNDVLDQLDEWGLGGGLGRMTRDRVCASAALVAVPTAGRTAADYIRAGMVVESVWVQAHALGLSVQPVSPLFIYADTGADLERLSPRNADTLAALSRKFTDLLQVDECDGLALVMRVGRTRVSAERSGRRADRVRWTGRRR